MEYRTHPNRVRGVPIPIKWGQLVNIFLDGYSGSRRGKSLEQQPPLFLDYRRSPLTLTISPTMLTTEVRLKAVLWAAVNSLPAAETTCSYE